MRPIPTETLLAANDKAALVGTYAGTVHAVVFPEKQSPEEREKWLRDNYSNAKHVPKTDETISVRHFGPLDPTEEPNVGFLNITKAQVLIQTYQDVQNNLNVRAAYNPVLNNWTVADL